jgi:hypothetical protein
VDAVDSSGTAGSAFFLGCSGLLGFQGVYGLFD